MPSTPLEQDPPPSLASVAPRVVQVPESWVYPLSVFGLELSLDTASLDTLEEVVGSVTKETVSAWFARFRGTEEVARLSTCHRLELVLLTRYPEELDRWRDVLPGPPGAWRVREGRDVVHHLFRVAAGQESLAVGEGEVRHQVKAAASLVASRHPRPVLRPLFLGAVRAAEEVSPSVPAARSIASAAVAHLRELLPEPFPRVLVVGSGTVGCQVVESLSPWARVTVAYHERVPDESFLRATGAHAIRLDRLAQELLRSDAVVTAAKFGRRGLGPHDLPRNRSLLLVDLGMPRNIDPAVRERSNVRLVDLEELYQRSEHRYGAPPSEPLLEQRARELSRRLEKLLLEPWVDTLRRAAEEVRRSELENARGYLGDLTPDQAVAVERLTERLVRRLLLPPTERIRSLPPGPEGDRARRVALQLLSPRPTDP